MLNLSTLALLVRDFMEPETWGGGIKTILPQAEELVIYSDDFPTPEICGEYLMLDSIHSSMVCPR